MYQQADPLAKAAMVSTTWELWREPTKHHFDMLPPPPPPPGARLLGLFDYNQVSIALFEDSLRWDAERKRIALATEIHETAVHELEHRFNLDHLHDLAASIAAAEYSASPSWTSGRYLFG